ncbi:MAG: TRAP transporter TatT component family protein [Lentisphaeria bacterium]|nr:TRAP transporter TatT component family protein [Lentisphaeria bacterium]
MEPGKARSCAVVWLGIACCVYATGCARLAINRLGDALAGSGTVFASDDDPDLVGDAIPFSLKLMESLLAERPKHEGLLLASASGFTQYAYAFVQQEADFAEEVDLERAMALRARACRLYRRARGYGLRGLEARHPGFAAALQTDPGTAVRAARKADVPFLYWTAAPWGSLLALSKDSPETLAEQPQVEALIDRAVELDGGFGGGQIHAFLIAYELARPAGPGDALGRSRRHFERAVELSRGRLAAPYVSFAETVCVKEQNALEFRELIGKALAIDPDAAPEARLENIIMQRRARWLLARADDLILPDAPQP